VSTPIPAAGTVPWRITRGTLEVALVHRPRYDDWSWAKGKLDPGEDWPVAAARETDEETGLLVGLGAPLPSARYTVLTKEGLPAEKEVRYWSARVLGGAGRLDNEIDEVAWLDAQAAYDRLDYARDRAQLLAVVRRHAEGRLDTWPLVLVRHAKAVSRSAFRGSDDTARPLDARGSARADALVPLLAAYGLTRLVTSPSLRCVDTLAPYAANARLRLRTKAGLSEEGFAAEPAKAERHLAAILARGEAAAVCSHGPVLPTLVTGLAELVDPECDGAVAAIEHLAEAADDMLEKGEALVCHVVGRGPGARVVAVERHLP
jgi:8-oxo-dGTP pyrophosphatase MutT (NUDIX family)/phosphohistidine phosphatase SixA